MRNENFIQVLWVEDDPEITETYPLEAARYGIQLVPFSCWQDAEAALLSDFKRWSAIVLDAKCKYKKESQDNAAVFLTQALTSIASICTQQHRVLPWYVLSGGSDDELLDLIIDTREEWDGDWKKKYYSKNTDREILFHRIPYHAKISPEMQIRNVFYKDVFNAIRRANLGDDVEIYMEDLLLPIHAYDMSSKDYNNRMTLVRKCIELLFHSMASYGLLPSKKEGDVLKLHDKLVDRRGGINITGCSKIIAGVDHGFKDTIIIKSNKNILPNVLKDSIQRLVEIAGAFEHAENKDASEEKQENSRHTSEFLDCIGNAPYLLRSMANELCCIILWYDQYILDNDAPEINALNWEIVDNSNFTQVKI